MASTANPAAPYLYPAVGDATLQSSRTQNRRGTGERDLMTSNPLVGRTEQTLSHQGFSQGPVISYRGVKPSADPTMHRSFSQRAKGKPVANAAFSDERFDEDDLSGPQRTTGRSISANYPSSNTHPLDTMATNGVSGQRSTQPERLQKNSTATAQSRSRAHGPEDVRAVDQAVSTPDATPLKGASNRTRDAANQTESHQRNWASDRSPLQKLEVKLTDISKEEKRARVQEAEMRLRESQGSQESPRAQRQSGQASRSVSQPVQITGRAGDQSTAYMPGTGQNNRDRIPSLPIVEREGIPRASRQNPRQPPRQGPVLDIPARQHGSITQRGRVSGPKQPVGITNSPDLLSTPTRIPGRASSARQGSSDSQMLSIASNLHPQLASIQQPVAKNHTRAKENPVTDRERNASHQAALQQLIGESSGSDPVTNQPQGAPRSNVSAQNTASVRRRGTSQDSPVAVDLSTLSGDDHRFDGAGPTTSQQSKRQLPQTQRSQPTVGLGVSSPPPTRSMNSHSLDNVDGTKKGQRKSSVSFKEPFDKRRPVDEWRTAETATLTQEDFRMEQTNPPDTYKPWWEQDQTRKASRARASSSFAAPAEQIDESTASFNPALYLKCGPLLRYTGLRRTKVEQDPDKSVKEFWRGTIMIVTQDSQCSYDELPTLRLFSQPKKLLPPPPALVTGDQLAPEYIDPIAGLTKLSRTGRAVHVRPVDHLEEGKDLSRFEDDTGIYEASPSPLDINGSKSATAAATNKRTLDMDGERLGRYKEVKGVRIYADPDRDVTFWRFNIEIELGAEQQHIAYRINKSASVGFWVPAKGKTMNIMFHSCNGFSLAVDSNTFSGPDPLWRDVLNNHQTRPFHVMLGGGDQIYNDRVMVDTQHFGEWTRIRNPHHKHHAPFTPEMKNELEDFYLERYSMWFSQGLFGMASASIPMVNIWDDHDIIDGFGSYPDDFMRSPVFSGLGEIAHKYYLLFQHQSIDTMTDKEEPSWVLGRTPGPYIKRLSRSVYLELGQSVAFLGLDGRTERTRNDVISIDTLEHIMEHCRKEMTEGRTKHLIILLGVPIAYPRLVWLENVLTSRALDPIKALHRAGIVKTKLLNRFDGGVEILDDLDDHWTATNHKDERNILIEDLQDLAAERSARITILSGDVHLAAVGQFYSNPKLKIPKDKDHRYMPNIISSAIVNTPPPDLLADVLNKRNKVHHLDKYTDENMIPMFTHDVDEKKRNNTRLLPRRNWCSIREYVPGDTPPPSPSLSPSLGEEDDISYDSEVDGQNQDSRFQQPQRRLSLSKNDFNPRNLIRRFSSRGAPPNSYRTGNDSNQVQRRAASLDEVERGQVQHNRSSQIRSSSADNVAGVPTLRPTFHRRPTNLSEKAARKGIVPAIDANGNEVDFNDHVNLEGGLDIVLNCEINQKDPAGITTPYRLLVPALSYDGSSDIQKLNTAPAPTRSASILKKFGFKPRAENRPADSQGAGNWGQEMSETESYTESEEGHEKPPKNRWSLFGSRRKKQAHQPERHDTPPPNLDTAPIGQNQQSAQQAVQNNIEVPRNSNAVNTGQNFGPSMDRSVKYEASRDPRISQRLAAQTNQNAQQSSQGTSSQRSSQRTSRPLSYTISGAGGSATPSEYPSIQPGDRALYDPDAAYVSNQQRNHVTGMPRSSSEGQNNQSRTRQSYSDHEVQSGKLRGNGIIGNHVPPTSFRNSNVGTQQGSQQQDTPQGYSGIEAYKEPKPRRRWSLKDRARNVMGSLGPSRQTSGDEWYSDEEDEAYWEGPKRPWA